MKGEKGLNGVKLTSNPPPSRFEASSAMTFGTDGPKLWVYGGLGKKKMNDLWSVRVGKESISSWVEETAIGQLPVGRSGHVMLLISRTQMLMYGGSGTNGINYFNGMFILETGGSCPKWSMIQPVLSKGISQLPTLAEHTATLVGQTVYFFGGKSSQSSFSSDLFCLDLLTMKVRWINKSTGGVWPTARCGHTMVYHSGYLYLHGGTDSTSMELSDLWRFHIEKRMWSFISSQFSPPARSHHKAVIHEDVIITFGGRCGAKIQNNFYVMKIPKSSNVYWDSTLSTQKWSWTELKVLVDEKLIGRSDHVMELCYPSVYIFGGLTVMERGPSSCNELFLIHLQPMEAFLKEQQEREESVSKKSMVELPPTKLVAVTHWLDCLKIHYKLGSGAFGTVYYGTIAFSPTDIPYDLAVKKIHSSGLESLIDEVLHEYEMLKSLKNKNIVSVLFSAPVDNDLWIVTEFCDLGSVSDLINLRGKGFCAGSIAVVVFQTLLGLKYLHETDIIHRDLKAANLLVNRYGQVKIGDFGLAGKLNIIRQQGDIAGTLLWMAPEVLQRRDLDKSCDIWSLGITIIEMADCYPPFMELQTERQVKRQFFLP
eukprot:TRINITY_DN6083_c0_g1_i1.p1 TRINITY_DN6083_c0_g1~~TRINITY_DN6083_c0_g1_i1.p1  ORF type:complete len:596 (-),score=96.14 TRINITY_DN6083_c0_g1_i1:263-2050(-)